MANKTKPASAPKKATAPLLVVDEAKKPKAPQPAGEVVDLSYELCGWKIGISVDNDGSYRGNASKLGEEIAQYLSRFNASGEKMDRHGCATVCGSVTRLFNGYGVNVISPCSVKSELP